MEMERPAPPDCAAALIDWLQHCLSTTSEASPSDLRNVSQPLLFRSAPYVEDAPAIRTPAEFEGALEHLEYAIFRRHGNQLTRAERGRLDNTIDNALFKADRYAGRLDAPEREMAQARVEALRQSIVERRAHAELLRHQAKRADLKLSQLGSLTPEGFEEFVAELFEALGYEVERCGGTGDEGADLRVFKAGLRGIVQCKYHSRGVVGSPELQKFLGSVHHNQAHKGVFVTTRTFTLAAERFASDHPIELIDGPRLVELVQEALGPAARREPEPAWF